MKQTKYRKAVFIVVYAREKDKTYYVILKRKKHWHGWEFPKGGVESGENLIKAVKRETFEEVGLKSKKIKRFNIQGRYKYQKMLKDRPGIIGQISTLFSVEVKKGRIRVDKREHYYGKWMEFKEAMKKLTWKDQKICLKMVDGFFGRKR